MNQNSGHPVLENDACFYDGKELKLRNKLTNLTLSMHHPLLCKQIPLAIMDCQAEKLRIL